MLLLLQLHRNLLPTARTVLLHVNYVFLPSFTLFVLTMKTHCP